MTRRRPSASSPRTSNTHEDYGPDTQKREPPQSTREVPMSSKTIDSRSPQAPDDVVVSTAATDRAATQRMAERARQSGAAWTRASAAERAEALIAAAASLADAVPEMAELTMREVGKPIAEARLEIE